MGSPFPHFILAKSDLWSLIIGDGDAMSLALGIALIVTYAAVLGYLLVMLVTRWGDHNATAKSLILSVLLHLSLGFGWATVSLQDHVSELTEKAPPPAPIEPIRLNVENDIPVDEQADVPEWQRPVEISPLDMARVERQADLDDAPTPAERRRNEVDYAPDIPTDLDMQPDQPAAIPERVNAADQGPEVVAAEPILIDAPQAEARPDVAVPMPTLSRTPRMGVSPAPNETESARAERPIQRFAPDPSLRLESLDLAEVPDSPIAIPPSDDEIIERPAGVRPAETSDITPERADGSEDRESRQETPAGGTPRFTRTPRRIPNAVRDGGAESRMTRRTPSTPESLADAGSLVRRGVTAPDLNPDLEPNAVMPDFDALREPGDGQAPATYRLRQLETRRDIALQNGGTAESEKAVEASLLWLVAHQDPEGRWDADGFTKHCPEGELCTGHGGTAGTDPQGVDRRGAGTKADTGITGLAILAFLGAGYTHEEGQYADNVDRAIRWLVRQQRQDGYLGGESTYFASMYCHGIALYALAEALGMQSEGSSNPWLRRAVARGVAYTLSQQNEVDGGWRYRKGQQSDMSMFGWHLMALKSAELAGIPMSDDVRDRLVMFLRERSVGNAGALAAYRKDDRPTTVMTAEALFCKQMLGIRRENPASRGAVAALENDLPRIAGTNYYYWYYGTLSMFQYGGEPWQRWNGRVRDILIQTQRKEGHAAGSWDPKSTWGGIGGRVYTTALATMSLEVYYRFLPLYQINDQVTER